MALMPILPSASAIAVFKPFFWGYLLLGFSHGVAWYWAGRVIALFLVTIEFFMVLTKGSKPLSVAAAVVFTFSPYAQWWACFEVLLFGQLIVVLLHYFLRSNDTKIKMLCAAGTPWAAGCYLFVVYPAWMVPCFYVFLVFGIWTIGSYSRSRRAQLGSRWVRDNIPALVSLCVALAATVFLAIVSFLDGSGSIEGMSMTVYPGARFYVGGDGWGELFKWLPSIFYAIDQGGLLTTNPCDISTYFSLFPVGIIVGLYAALKFKRPIIIALLLLDAFFYYYLLVGVPDIVAKVTLLSYVGMANRFMIATGFLDVSILIMSLNEIVNANKGDNPAMVKHGLTIRPIASSSTVSAVVAFAVCVLACIKGNPFWNAQTVILLFVMVFSIFATLLSCILLKSQDSLRAFCMALSVVVAASGICVNPIQRGVSALTDSESYKMVSTIADENPNAIWISEGSFVYGNLCMAAGAPTLTSTNVYPNVDAWNLMDPNGDYDEVYLRYSNIDGCIDEDGSLDRFELLGTDHIQINFTPEDLKNLGVEYLFAATEHDDTDEVSYEEVGRCDNRIIYRLQYAA